MLKTLRGRLLASYFIISLLTLMFVSVGLFFLSIQPGIRYIPVLQHLETVSRNTTVELLRLRETGADETAFLAALQETAAANNVRVLVVNANTSQVLFDSNATSNWKGITIADVAQPARLLARFGNNATYGRFQHPDGTRWVVYAQSFASSRIQIYYAVREPTPLSFFREYFSRPLWWAGITAIMLSVLFAFLIAGSVATPLQKMAAAAEAVAQGNYQQEVPLTGPDEVRRVAASFNDMAQQVANTQQAQRDFVANVSHDLKTPITSIQGWSQALMDGTAVTPEEQQQAATIIHNEAARMARMVNQLLDLARLESGQITLAQNPVDLVQILTDLHRSLQRRAQEKNLHFTLETAPVPPIFGDHDRLMQLFQNLVDNAFAHTPAGGRVHLAVAPHGEGAVEVKVQDTGEGIPAKDLPRIFERFYQVDKSRAQGNTRRGSGLGLAIVQELVAAHHGRIQAFSEEGKGTLFIVRFPTSTKPAGTTLIKRSP